MKNNIRVERAKRHISQENLADAIKVTRQTIYSIENGITEPKLQLAYKISGFFKLKIEDVFENE